MNASQLAAWVELHPVLFAVVIWPVISGAVSWVFKPRSAEDWAKLPAPVAAALKLACALGLDAPKVLDGLKLLVGKAPPPPPPPAFPKSETPTKKDLHIVPPPPPSGPYVARVAMAWASVMLVVIVCQGCSMFSKQNAKGVLDVATVACILANFTSDDATVQAMCKVVDELAPDMRKLLAEERAALAKAQKAGVCGPQDAGADH